MRDNPTKSKRFDSVEQLVTETAADKQQVAEFLQRKLRATEAERDEIRNAVRLLRDAKGRHHTQIAMERLIAILPENKQTT